MEWIRPLSSNFVGINDSSIYTFKERKYESLAREILQNSLDERKSENEKIRVEFKNFDMDKNKIPNFTKFKNLFEDGLEYWKDDNQNNGREFYEDALKILSNNKIKVMRISDFNTKGVLGSDCREKKSSKDITPWFNLVKSEGSSSKGGNQGGSFGIGKNATFANSGLRTIFYSTYDKNNLKAYEGVAKLSTVFKNNKQFSYKAYYGNLKNEDSIPIQGLPNFDDRFIRNNHGTDIYIFGFEVDEDWEVRMLSSVLSDFIIPINNNTLEVTLGGKLIDSSTLKSLYEENIEYCEDNKLSQIRDVLKSAYNYYKILVSDETMEFNKEFGNLGNARFKVLYSPEFERKIMRTRETGMKLFERGGVSSSIGFSGIVTLQGEKLNKIFRKMENPAHTAWSEDNINNSDDKRTGKKLKKKLNKWMKDTVLENAADQELDKVDVVGLGEYLPIELTNEDNNEEEIDNSETVTDNVSDITSRTQDREDLINRINTTKVEEDLGDYTDGGEDGEIEDPGGNETEDDGGRGERDRTTTGEGDRNIYRKVNSNDYKPRLIKNSKYYNLIIKPKKDLNDAHLKVYISGETSSIKAPISYAENTKSFQGYFSEGNVIYLDDLRKDNKLALKLELENKNNYSLEVELYENTTQ